MGMAAEANRITYGNWRLPCGAAAFFIHKTISRNGGKEQMRQEKLYQATMSMVRKMLAEGLITEEEYRQIDTMFLAKYRPLFGTLFSEIC